ncbi:uncharacterized protein TRIVIDRAFT_224542 [Trichoderma virens Gv29-8]|uniref:Uncharacterized protein n=1 Tax=Hypocrea virens (strain Gv29-8 / FGSC 10586) TaxID=413071 RepID=G9N0K0_HYPVG|nr:uncharacterized protein TRIVIDRAFT_224542 [Trichoderma virens Gv29-8]EHK19882.1 hypothetical protein TRIVIDRAFT_224542 [Trichoderma virens Gv29-8]
MNRQLDRSGMRGGASTRGGFGGFPGYRSRPPPFERRPPSHNNLFNNRYSHLENIDRNGGLLAELNNDLSGIDSSNIAYSSVANSLQSQIDQVSLNITHANEQIAQMSMQIQDMPDIRGLVMSHDRSIGELWDATDRCRDGLKENKDGFKDIKGKVKQLVDIFSTSTGDHDGVDPATLSYPQLSG